MKEISRRDILIGGAGIILGLVARDIFKRDDNGGSTENVEPSLITAPFDRIAPQISQDLIDNISVVPAYQQPLIPDGFAYTLDQGQFPTLKPYEMSGLEFGRPFHKVYLPEKQLLIFDTNNAKWVDENTRPIAVYSRTPGEKDFTPIVRGTYSYLHAVDEGVPLIGKDGEVIERYAGQVSLIAVRSDRDSPQINAGGIYENVFYAVTFQLRGNKLEPQLAVTLLI